MASLRNLETGWDVPVDYFSTKPRFRPFMVPYTELAVVVVDDDGNELLEARVDSQTGAVTLPR